MNEQVLKEWKRTSKKEGAFIHKNIMQRESNWQKKIEKYVPEQLSDTLDSAFFKAFELIFDKGTAILEKTYNKERKEQDYKVNEYAVEINENRKAIRAFGRKAKGSKYVNNTISAVEGIGMGVLGMGLPDIPLFLAVLLKSIYEIALHYGFSYDTEEEQMFILKVIEISLLHEKELIDGNKELNEWMERPYPLGDKEEQMKKTSKLLSEEMLYLKFIQGIPIVGLVGGVSDMVYQKKITDYAEMKYNRRFLLKKI